MVAAALAAIPLAVNQPKTRATTTEGKLGKRSAKSPVIPAGMRFAASNYRSAFLLEEDGMVPHHRDRFGTRAQGEQLRSSLMEFVARSQRICQEIQWLIARSAQLRERAKALKNTERKSH
jgi:hypothetical protein